MAANPTGDPTAFDDYYYGIGRRLKLLARSNPDPWQIPLVPGYWGGPSPDTKTIFVVTHHPLRQKLDAGLRDTILDTLATINPRKWISVDYLRIGYDKNTAQNNPVVALITVEKGQVPLAEAQRVVDAIAEECKRVNLPDVEVEVVEGERSTSTSADQAPEDIPNRQFDPQAILNPTPYPLIGSSIAISRTVKVSAGRGTLGGYVLVDGVVMGLTNHHVAFGDDRLEAFPTIEETSTAAYTFMQPAEGDLEDRITEHKGRLEAIEELKEDRSSQAYDMEIINISTLLPMLESWTSEKCILGTVWRSSGIRAREGIMNRRSRLDWALIKLDNPKRFSEYDRFINEIPAYVSLNRTRSLSYFKTAMKAANDDKKLFQMPKHLKRHLTLDETLNKLDAAEQEDKSLVVWKFGRTSHFTFGIVSHIHSNYLSTAGIVTDELAVVPSHQMKSDSDFSTPGDSGSLVWDSDGYVIGLLWGGLVNSVTTFVTPLEHVLEDIGRVCGAKDVRLVVRKEDETDVVFSPVKPHSGCFGGSERESGAGAGPSVDSDIEMGVMPGAESDN